MKNITSSEDFINELKEWQELYKKHSTYSREIFRIAKRNGYIDEELAETLRLVDEQGLWDARMHGDTITGFKVTEENPKNIIFAAIYDDLKDKEDFTIALYCLELGKRCLHDTENYDIKKREKIFGRGIRGFANFLREDFIPLKIKEMHPEIICKKATLEEDLKKHCDLKIINTINGREIYVWVTQLGKVENRDFLLQKFMGDRGEIPDGYHLVIPCYGAYDYRTRNEYGWYLPSDRCIDEIVERTYDEPINYNYLKEKRERSEEKTLKILSELHLYYKG